MLVMAVAVLSEASLFVLFKSLTSFVTARELAPVAFYCFMAFINKKEIYKTEDELYMYIPLHSTFAFSNTVTYD